MKNIFAQLLPWTLLACLLMQLAFLTHYDPYRAENAFTPPAAAMRPQAPQEDAKARYERLRAVNEGLEKGLLLRLEAQRER